MMDRRHFLNLTAAGAAGAFLLGGCDRGVPFSDEALAAITDAQAAGALGTIRREDALRAAIRVERGGPRLFLNDAEVAPLIGLSTTLTTTVGNYDQMGITLLQPQLGMASAWTGPGEYDFSNLATYLGRILALAPGAYFIPRVQLLTPRWWKEAHPDQITTYDQDRTGSRFYDVIRKGDLPLGEGDHYFTNFYGEAWEASYASEVWQRDTAEMLRAFVRYIESSPLRSRMAGYHFVHGRTEEWNMPGGDWLPDNSAPMAEAHAAKNGGAALPTAEERLASEYGLLRDPAQEANVIDFYRSLHEVRADAVARFAEAIKGEMGGRVLCGTFWGYLMEVPRGQESGHLAPLAALDSPHLDFVACPYTYQATNVDGADRRDSDMVDGAGNWLGRARGVAGDGGFRAMLESVRRRGKLYISEVDPSTYLDETNQWRGIGGTGSETQEGSIQILRRDLGKVFAEGVGGWLYDFGPYHDVPTGWYGSEPIIAAVREVNALMQQRLARDIGSVAEVVLVGDTESFYASKHWLASKPWPGQGIRYSDFFNHWFLNAQARSLGRIGAPFDLLYRFDFSAEDARRYKLVLVPNAFLMPPDEVDAMLAMLRGSGATVVWYYAPGLLQPSGIAPDQMAKLTGLTFEEIADGELLINARVGDFAQAFGVKSTEVYGPRFAVKDADAEVLGAWRDTGETAFARKEMDGWTSVYVGTAPLTAEWLRRLATEAGAALWTDRPAIVNATRGAAQIVATDDEGGLGVTFPAPYVPESGGAAITAGTLPVGFGDVRLFLSEA